MKGESCGSGGHITVASKVLRAGHFVGPGGHRRGVCHSEQEEGHGVPQDPHSQLN